MLNFINEQGQPIPNLNQGHEGFSAGIMLHIHVSDTKEDFILASNPRTQKKYVFNHLSPLFRESLLECMLRSYEQTLFHGFEDADREFLFPRLTANDITTIYVNDKKATGLAHITMTQAELTARMAELNDNASIAIARYNKKFRLNNSHKAVPGAVEMDLARYARYAEFNHFHLFKCEELIFELSYFEASNFPDKAARGKWRYLDIDGKTIDDSAAKNAYPLFKFGTFKEPYAVSLAREMKRALNRREGQLAKENAARVIRETMQDVWGNPVSEAGIESAVLYAQDQIDFETALKDEAFNKQPPRDLVYLNFYGQPEDRLAALNLEEKAPAVRFSQQHDERKEANIPEHNPNGRCVIC